MEKAPPSLSSTGAREEEKETGRDRGLGGGEKRGRREIARGTDSETQR